MNNTEFVNNTTNQYRALNDAKIRATLAKYPDADWHWAYPWVWNPETRDYDRKLQVYGTIWVGTVERELVDLLEYATACDADQIRMSTELENYDTGTCKVIVVLEAEQPLRPSQKKLLKSIGIIQTERVNPSKPRAYTNTYLACRMR